MLKIEKINSILLFILIFQAIIEKFLLANIHLAILDYYNEIIIIMITLLLIYSLIRFQKAKKILIYSLVILFYSLFQILIRKLPFYHISQSFLYIECVVFFTYFYSLGDSQKINTLEYLTKYYKYLTYIVIFASIIELLNPNIINNILGTEKFERGINGFYLTSIFGTTTGLSQFCITVIVLSTVMFGLKNVYPYNKWLLISVVILSFLSFSRKEFALIAIYLIVTNFIIKNKSINIKHYLLISFTSITIVSLYLLIFFKKANEVALSDGYVRFQLIEYSIRIIKDYFPFGTGPGTFGSQLSLQYPIIYEKYGIGQNILGYNGARGPIYDAFFFTFTAEMGVGILIYASFMIAIWKKQTLVSSALMRTTKKFVILTIIIIGLFAPIIMNPFGLICFSILGLITKPNIK